MSARTKIHDTISEALGFTYAVRMLSTDLAREESTALDLIAEQIDTRLRAALSVIEDKKEEWR